MVATYTFSFPDSCSGLGAQVFGALGDAVGDPTVVDPAPSLWAASSFSAVLAFDAAGYTATVTDGYGIDVATARGVIDVEAAIGASSGSGGLLCGHGAPGSGDGLDALDGINDPWRWSALFGGWVGPAFEITTIEGSTIDLSGVSLPAGSAEVSLVITAGTSPADAKSGDYVMLSDNLGASNLWVDFTTDATATAAADATGIAFLVQYETDWAGPTAVPDDSLDIADHMTVGFALGDPYEFPDVTTGADGQFYIDLDTRDLYGPRTAGAWTRLATLPAPE